MGIDVKMAWRNVWRNPRRSVLTMAAIAFATLLLVFMLSWQFGSYETMINSTVKIHTGHLQVQARGYRDQGNIYQVVPDPTAVMALLDGLPGVLAAAPRAEAFALVSSKERTYGSMVVGIDPAGEASVSTLKRMVKRGRYFSEEDTRQALVGRLLARNLKVDPADELVVLGQGRDGSIAAAVVGVEGIFDSGQDAFDRGVMQMPLPYFQEVFSMGNGVHAVVVVCDALDRVAGVKAAIVSGLAGLPQGKDLVVLDWKELNPGLIQAIKMDLFSGFIFYIILIVVVAFSILNTFLMAIFERTREFGVMMAVGTTPGRLMRLLLFESGTLTFFGVAVGLVAGASVTWYFQTHGILIPGAEEMARQFGLPERMYPQLSLLSALVGAGIVLAITSITAIYPAVKVRRLKPVEALAAT